MGDEAGQLLENILVRKELERELGNGLFIWGIGNSLGDTIWKYVSEKPLLKVFFSKIKSKPKIIDSKPKKVYYWTHYQDRFNKHHKLPEHALVLSRGHTNKALKKKHYALICHKKESIQKEKWEQINFYSLKNIYSKANKIGYSQVTAIVERNSNLSEKTNFYEMIFSADLVKPYFVTLINPIEIKLKNLRELERLLSLKVLNKTEWKHWLLDFKKRQGKKQVANLHFQSELSFKKK